MEITEEQYNFWKKELLKFIPREDIQEVLHEVLLQFLTGDYHPDCLDAYIIGSCCRSYYSTTSPYARQENKHLIVTELGNYDREDANLTDYEKLDILKYIDDLKGVSWWEKECFKRKILEDKTFKKLAEEYDLMDYQVIHSYKKVRNLLRKKLKKDYFE